MAIEAHKNYKAALVESIKVAGQMIIDMAEDIAGQSDYISGLNVSANFDPDLRNIPEITITRSHLPDQQKLEHILDCYNGKKSEEE